MRTFSKIIAVLMCSLLLLAVPFFASAEEATEASPSVFEELFELKWYTAAVLISLTILGVILLVSARRTKWDSRRIANAAMCIAISYVLSLIKLYRMPQGGSITPGSMLPIVAFAVACGPLQGAIVGCASGLLGLIQDPYVIHPIQMLVDYPLASGALALGGLVRFLPIKKQFKLPLAVLIGAFGRYLMAVLSGVVFFAESAPVGQSTLIYSLLYNISYLGFDTLVCILIAALPGIYRIVDIIRGNIRTAR